MECKCMKCIPWSYEGTLQVSTISNQVCLKQLQDDVAFLVTEYKKFNADVKKLINNNEGE